MLKKLLVLLGFFCAVQSAWGASEEVLFVSKGIALDVYEQGKIWRGAYKPWTTKEGYLEGIGDADGYHQTKQLVAGKAVGKGDFRIKARLSIHGLKGSGASLVINNDSYLVFSSSQDEYYDTIACTLQGPLFGSGVSLGVIAIKEGQPFTVQLVRTGNELRFLIDDREVHKMRVGSGEFGSIGLRPWWSTMRVFDFSLEGQSMNLQAYYHRTPENQPLFVGGTDGYTMYKIPALLATERGTILAFCEARHWASDAADMEIVVKRSEDNGKTWSKQLVIWDDGTHTCGNPCPVEDLETGDIWMLMCRDNDRVYATCSKDDGRTWSQAADITPTVKRQDWRWYATGPGTGIQMERGKYKGRLVIPSDHRSVDYGMGSHAVYSDDHGKTWKYGSHIEPKTNECQVVELTDGSLMMNMRSYNRKGCRAIASSKNGGESWSPIWHDQQLIEPVCQASILRASSAEKAGKDRLLFSNPAAQERVRLTARLSYDEGKSWPVSKLMYSGPSGYSSLAVLSDGSIGCLFEAGLRHWNEIVFFAKFPLEWLTDGNDLSALEERVKLQAPAN